LGDGEGWHLLGADTVGNGEGWHLPWAHSVGNGEGRHFLGPTQWVKLRGGTYLGPTQWVTVKGGTYPAVKRLSREAYRLPLCSADVGNEWSCHSTSTQWGLTKQDICPLISRGHATAQMLAFTVEAHVRSQTRQRGIFEGRSAISPSSSAFRRLRHSTSAAYLRLSATDSAPALTVRT
jgi:hypothetical protein